MFTKQYDGTVIRKAVTLYLSGKMSFRLVAEATGVSKSSVHRWVQTLHHLIHRPKKTKRTRKPKFPSLIMDVKRLLDSSDILKFTSLSDLQICLPYKVSKSWLRVALRKARVSRRRFTHVKTSGSTLDTEPKVMAFKSLIQTIPLEQIVCVDETGFLNRGNSIYGYFPMGKCPKVIHNRSRERLSCAMAISSSRVLHASIQQTPFNTSTYQGFLQTLLPLLPQHVKYILMDNVSFHHSYQIKQLITSKGLSPLFIPPYSPQFNPIEEVFSILKRRFRKLYCVNQMPFGNAVNASIRDISSNYITSNNYSHAFRSWLKS